MNTLPSDSEMLFKLDLVLEKHNDIPLLLLGDFNVTDPIWDKNCKASNKNSKILEDIVSQHNIKIKMTKTQHTCIKDDLAI